MLDNTIKISDGRVCLLKKADAKIQTSDGEFSGWKPKYEFIWNNIKLLECLYKLCYLWGIISMN